MLISEIAETELQYLDEKRYDERAELFTADASIELPGIGGSRGREAIRAEGHGNIFDEGLSDRSHENRGIYVDGEVAVVESVYRGIHRGTLSLPFIGDVPPTGKPIAVPFVIVYEFEGGLIKSKRTYFDWHAFATPVES